MRTRRASLSGFHILPRTTRRTEEHKDSGFRMHNRTGRLLTGIAVATLGVQADAFSADTDDMTFSASLRGNGGQDALHGEVVFEEGRNTTFRFGLSFFASDKTDLHGGYEVGARINGPWRISPFVGGGIFAGSWTTHEPATDDGVDNDDDSVIDEAGEEKEITDYLWAVYPEAGLHIWLTDAVRITGTYRYYVTTDGRDSDAALYGVGLGFAMK